MTNERRQFQSRIITVGDVETDLGDDKELLFRSTDELEREREGLHTMGRGGTGSEKESK